MVDFTKKDSILGDVYEMDTDYSEELEDDIFEDDIDVSDVDHYDELVTFLSEEEHDQLSADIMQDIEEDIASRETWEDNLVRGLKNLGLSSEEGSEAPFDGACTAHHPLVLEAVVKFQSKASAEMLPPDGPVKTKVYNDKGNEEAVLQAANRIKSRLNYQTTEEMTEYYSETEKALFCTALCGDAFKKKYFSPEHDRVMDEMIPPTRLIVNNGYSNIESADRLTHIIYKSENDMEIDFYNGVFVESDLGEPTRPELTPLEETVNNIMGISSVGECYTLYEHHCYLTLNNPMSPTETPRPLPYVVVLEKSTGKILSLKRNWEEGSKTFSKTKYFSHYQFIPWMGFLSLGYVQLLGNWQQTLTAVTRSLVDAGQFANMPAGFKSKMFRVSGGEATITPGTFLDVEAFSGQDISKGIMPLPFKEPSAVLYNMLGYLDAKGEKFASASDAIAESGSNYGPVGTTLALLDASGKTESAIHKRLHNAQKQELKIIFDLDKLYDPEEIRNPETQEVMATQDDYKVTGVEIVPVSDPNISSQAHKLAIAQAKLGVAQQFQNTINVKPILREIFTVLGSSNEAMNEMFPQPQEAQPQDPMSDILAATRGMPIAAFPGQNHDAHISVKQNWANDPRNGGNEMMAGAKEKIMANISEHMVLKYQEQMQGLLQTNPEATQQAGMDYAMSVASQEILQYNSSNEYRGTPEEILTKVEEEKVMNERMKIMAKNKVDNKKLMLDFMKLMSNEAIDSAELELELQKFLMTLEKDTDQFAVQKAIELAKANKEQKLKQSESVQRFKLGDMK